MSYDNEQVVDFLYLGHEIVSMYPDSISNGFTELTFLFIGIWVDIHYKVREDDDLKKEHSQGETN
jgi:hypothetical protein